MPNWIPRFLRRNPSPEEPENADRSELFFYTWWALKSEEDFHILLNDSSAYPRDLGKGDRIEYKEPGTKDRVVILNNHKENGKVIGTFLGMNGMVELETPFENQTVYNLTPEQYPIVALGAAVARREDWKLDERSFRTLNPEDLRWKWYMWDLTKGGKQAGTVKGRLVEKKSLSIACPAPSKPDHAAALNWAKSVVENTMAGVVGMDGHTVNLSYTLQGTPQPQIPATTKSENGINGIFEFKNIPYGATKIKLTSPQLPGYKVEVEFPDPLPDFEHKSQEAYHNVVISKDPKAPTEEEVLLEPSIKCFEHVVPLTTPFSTKLITKLTLTPAVGRTPVKNSQLGFRIKSAKNVPTDKANPRFYHAFFCANKTIVDAAQLATLLNISEIKLTFKGGGPMPPLIYSGGPAAPFFRKYAVKDKVAVTVSVDFKGAPAPGYHILFAFIAVQKSMLSPADQATMDGHMYHVAATNDAAARQELVRHGVLDFNFMPLLIHVPNP